MAGILTCLCILNTFIADFPILSQLLLHLTGQILVTGHYFGNDGRNGLKIGMMVCTDHLQIALLFGHAALIF